MRMHHVRHDRPTNDLRTTDLLRSTSTDLLTDLTKHNLRRNLGPYRQPSRRGRRARLVFLALLLALALGRLGADLLVVLLEGREVLAGLPCRATHRVEVRAAPGIEAAAGAEGIEAAAGAEGIEAAAGAAQGIEAAVGAAGRTSENSPSSMPSPTYQ